MLLIINIKVKIASIVNKKDVSMRPFYFFHVFYSENIFLWRVSKMNTTNNVNEKEDARDYIRQSYTKVALKSTEGGCCDGGCCCSGNPVDISETSHRIGYSEEELINVPIDSNMGLGCGNPIAIAAIQEGETVLDLGSGGGFDCFLARRQVGDNGYVIGVDMTSEMIKLARKNAIESGYINVDFRLGEIEHLPVADASIDVIISNCVINLSLDKMQVFKDAYRVLKKGGRLSISDVVATVQLPDNIKRDLAMVAGCIGGAEYVEDIRNMLEDVGFQDIKMVPKDNTREIIKSWIPDTCVDDYVSSYIIEARK